MAVAVPTQQKGGGACRPNGKGFVTRLPTPKARSPAPSAQFAPQFLAASPDAYRRLRLAGKGKAQQAALALRGPAAGQGRAGAIQARPQVTTPVLRLDDAEVAEIRAFLESHGGAVPLGKLATERPGLKKAQLEPYFHLVMPPGQNSDYMVSSDGIVPSELQLIQPLGQTRKRSRDEQAFVTPLDDVSVQSIREFVERCGGSVPLGNLTTIFEGVKKAQLLKAGFLVSGGEAGEKDCVTLDPGGTVLMGELEGLVEPAGLGELGALAVPNGLNGLGSLGGFEAAAAPENKKRKKKKEQDPNAPPPLPLDWPTLQKITKFLESSGGSLSLGKLTTQFEGLKKVQLEPHFLLEPDPRGAGNGDFMVSLLVDLPSPFGASAAMLQQSFDALDSIQAPIVQVAARPSGAGTQTGAQASSKKKKAKAKRDPDAPPPPALAQAKVDEIAAYLQLNGGLARLGKLTTEFPGLKKVQVEPHFVVCGDASVDLTVCVDISTARANGFLIS